MTAIARSDREVQLLDSAGAPITSQNRLPVDVGAAINIGNLSVNFESVISTANSITAPLAANATFTGAWEIVTNYASIAIIGLVDQNSAANGASVQFSVDGTTVDRSVSATIPANVGSYFELAPEAKYFRLVYTNGPVAQTSARMQVIYRFNPPGNVQMPLGSTVTDLNSASIVKSHLSGRQSSGVWKSIAVDASGNLQVTGPLTDAQLRASPLGVSDSTAQTKLQAIIDRIPAALDADGGMKVHVQNPTTNPETGLAKDAHLTDGSLRGTVVVSNPTTNPETGLAKDARLTDGTQKTQVTNFPATQPVSGTVTVANPTTNPETGLAKTADITGFASKIPDEEGTWGYKAGASGTPTLPAGSRVIGIAAHATTAGTLTINGGDSIPIPANVGIDLAPRANVIQPTLVFTGTDSYMVEYVV